MINYVIPTEGRNLSHEIALLRFLIPLRSIRNDMAIARLTSQSGIKRGGAMSDEGEGTSAGDTLLPL